MFNHFLKPCLFPLVTLLLLVATSEQLQCLMNHNLCSRKARKVESNKGKMHESVFVDMKEVGSMSRHAKATRPIARTLKTNGKMNATSEKIYEKQKDNLAYADMEHQPSGLPDRPAVETEQASRVVEAKNPEKEASGKPNLKKYRQRLCENEIACRKNEGNSDKRTHKKLKSNKRYKTNIPRQLHDISTLQVSGKHQDNLGSIGIEHPFSRILSRSADGAEHVSQKPKEKSENEILEKQNLKYTTKTNDKQEFSEEKNSDFSGRRVRKAVKNKKSHKAHLRHKHRAPTHSKAHRSHLNKSANKKVFLKDKKRTLSKPTSHRKMSENRCNFSKKSRGFGTLCNKKTKRGFKRSKMAARDLKINNGSNNRSRRLPQNTSHKISESDVTPLTDTMPSGKVEILKDDEMGTTTAQLAFLDERNLNAGNVLYDGSIFRSRNSRRLPVEDNDIHVINLREEFSSSTRMPREAHQGSNSSYPPWLYRPDTDQSKGKERNIMSAENIRPQEQKSSSSVSTRDTSGGFNLEKDKGNDIREVEDFIPVKKSQIVYRDSESAKPGGMHETMKQLRIIYPNNFSDIFEPSEAPFWFESDQQSYSQSRIRVNVPNVSLEQANRHEESKTPIPTTQNYRNTELYTSQPVNDIFTNSDMKKHNILNDTARSQIKKMLLSLQKLLKKSQAKAQMADKHANIPGQYSFTKNNISSSGWLPLQRKHHLYFKPVFEEDLLNEQETTSYVTDHEEPISDAADSSEDQIPGMNTVFCWVLGILGLIFISSVTIVIFLAALRSQSRRKRDFPSWNRKCGGVWGFCGPEALSLERHEDEKSCNRMVAENRQLKSLLNRVLESMVFNSDAYLKHCYSSKKHRTILQNAMSGIVK